MATDSQKIEAHFDFLPRKTKKAFLFLSQQKWLDRPDWYLAGGTALALQVGHRKSIDLDFFNTNGDFDNVELLGYFKNNVDWKTFINKKNTIYGELFGGKVSFIGYYFFVPKQPFVKYGFINLLKPLDIAVMKVIAISQRGRKRDFFDLYWCVKNIEPLENIVKRLRDQYPSVAHNYHHILTSLAYFNDAEVDPQPEIHFKVTWEEVKRFFQREAEYVMRSIVL